MARVELSPDEAKVLMTKVLNEYAKCGVIGRACDNAGVRRGLHTEWLTKYPKYKELFETVRERFVDGLEIVAIERAKEKSDSLLKMMLEAHRPDTYRPKTEVDLKTKQAPITLLFSQGMLTEDEKRLIEEASKNAST